MRQEGRRAGEVATSLLLARIIPGPMCGAAELDALPAAAAVGAASDAEDAALGILGGLGIFGGFGTLGGFGSGGGLGWGGGLGLSTHPCFSLRWQRDDGRTYLT